MKQIKIDQVIEPTDVLLNVQAKDRFDLITKLAAALEGREGVLDPKLLAEDAILREKELSTGLEHGIAMPHARTRSVSRLVTLIARLSEPIDFEAPDGSSSDLIFFSAVPPKGLDEYLHLVAQIVRKLAVSDTREGLRSASNSEEVLSLLTS